MIFCNKLLVDIGVPHCFFIFLDLEFFLDFDFLIYRLCLSL